MTSDSVRRALYVLFARLLAGPPDAALYARFGSGGLRTLAAAQGVELTSDLLDDDDAEASATELEVEYARLASLVSLRASDYVTGTEDPVTALSGFLREHRLRLDRDAGVEPDHLSVALGIMGQLAAQEDAGAEDDASARAHAFFVRHIHPWAQQALSEVAARADRNFYRGVAAMVSAFLASEGRRYGAA